MSSILVIGSNSFSASTFIKYAISQGSKVFGVSRSDEPKDIFLPHKWSDFSSYKFYKYDLNNDLNEINNLIQYLRPDYVVNFAAQSMVGESWNNPSDWFMTNTVSTVKFHDSLRCLDFLKRYVHISTPEVYGSCSGFVNEDALFNPSTPYAVSRAAADMSLHTFRSAYNFPFVITRAANVYGPGQQLYRIIPRTIIFILLGRKISLHGGGISTRSFIHMEDVSRATWKIMKDGRNGDTYHISTNDVISIQDLVKKICKKMNVNYEEQVEFVGDRIGKDSAYHLDSQKIRDNFEWKENINLDQGLNECIKWIKSNIEVIKQEPLDYIHKS